MKKFYDIVLVGGGLANSLIAHRLKNVRPDVEFLLLEQNANYAGHHTWSFHETDLTALEWSWVAPLVSKTWGVTEVRFPDHRRILTQRVHSLRSSDLNHVLNSELTYQVGRNKKAVDVTPTQVILEDGFAVQASCVIDGRGWNTTSMVKEGFRKFLGLEIELKNSHDIDHPVLIDATVFQNDGAHFVSLFPWSDTHLLIVDNYYSNTPFLHAEKLRKDILNSVEKRGWVLKSIEREEYGVRAIPLEGALGSWSEGVVLSGARGGFFHATTGDSFAYAARFADAVAHMKTFEARKVFAAVQSWARKHWRDQSFYRRFNRKIFQAENGQRCRIFQELYAQPQARIARFYQGRLSWWDKLWFSYPPTPSSSDTTSSR